ncbi:MAG: VOC family protein [Chloroflexota bacterium]|nr:VOC family protein [Chloroflexota bacterium]
MGYLSPTIAVRDMKRAIEFYRDVLGFDLGAVFPSVDDLQNAAYADLSKDGMVLMLIPAASTGVGADERLGIGVNFYMEIDGNLDDYYAELKRRGVAVAVDIKDEPFGIRDFTVKDADGYHLTFVNRLQER